MARLVDPVTLAGRRAPSRAVFGPHETNLGRRRSLSERHVAYYERRAAGGAGVVVTETASVHPSDWPYERAPLASDCEPGWRSVAEACRSHGALVLGGLGHAGGQGSSAYSQAALWAPSAVADAVTREMPMVMADRELDELVEAFGAAAARAVAAGLDGVELDAGAYSLLRQFHSGLTNQRDDAYGADRLLLTRRVLDAVRGALGSERVLALRLSADELAPWAGVTPEAATEQVAALAESLDLLTVVRAGPFATDAYRPRAHEAPGFNRQLCRTLREVAAGRTAVVLQGSVVDPAMADAAVGDGTADLVELTRAQIADADLVAKVRAGDGARVRPCILCNQACHVRDPRNPLVSCVADPRAGHETTEAREDGHDPTPRQVLVVGGGPAGLECARVASRRGHHVRLVEAGDRTGGALRTTAAGPGRERLALLADWLEAECRAAGVEIETGRTLDAEALTAARDGGAEVVLATGSRPAPLPFPLEGPTTAVDALEALATGAAALPEGAVVVHDPVGGTAGVALAEWLAAAGRHVAVVTRDQVVGTLLSLTGDLAGANTRLQRAGVRRELRSIVRAVSHGRAVLEDVWTGERREIDCAVLVDCGPRLCDDALAAVDARRAGDCVAPRTVLEAVLEGRRRALELAARHREPAPEGAAAGR